MMKEMTSSLAKPFMKTEIMRVIKRQANIVSGLTGVTYQMMNLPPEEALGSLPAHGDGADVAGKTSP
jgi:uncharacterized protein Yka (UPF0111/DUF47 family)